MVFLSWPQTLLLSSRYVSPAFILHGGVGEELILILIGGLVGRLNILKAPLGFQSFLLC